LRLRPLIAAVAVVTAIVLVPRAVGVAGPPTIVASVPNPTQSTSVAFNVSSPPDGATVECKLDNEDFASCPTDKTYVGLAEGNHRFSARFVDAEGPGTEADFPWTIDVTPPSLSSLDGVTAEATGPGGAVVTWSTSISGAAVSCDPAPGSSFVLGTTEVDCTATDAAGNTASKPITVTVRDTTPPTLEQQSDVFVGQQSAAGAVATYAPSASDVVDGSPSVSCNPASGSVFPIGATNVTCRAEDEAGNTSAAMSFTVTVQQGAIPGAPAITSHPPVLTNTTSAGFAFTAPDGSAAVRCSLDSATSVDCAGGTAAYSSLAEGGHLFVVEVENSVGNNSNASWNWTIDRTRPQAVGGVRARGKAGRVDLAWTRPTDADYRRVRLHRKRVGGATWRFVAAFRRATSYTDGAVKNDVRYRYRLFSFDRAGNRSPASGVTARPSRVFRPAWHAVLSSPPLIDWTAVRTASYYNLQIWRRSTKILSVWPVESRFRMRSTWRFRGRTFSFSTGRYTVYVWPGFGSKAAADYGRLRGWTRFSRG
jgi:hypothetical protein